MLGAVSVFYMFYEVMLSPDPHIVLVSMKDMYLIFNSILVIVVGYELLKSISYIITHNSIPVNTILKIAIIAISNKVITLDVKSETMTHMLGIAAIIASLGIVFFFNSKGEVHEH